MTRKPVNLVGRTYGQLTVIAQAENGRSGGRQWVCRCSCGVTKTIPATAFVYGRQTSCGCTRYKKIGDAKRTHGQSKTNLYLVWQAMINRCERPESESYPRYGGRGIRVCERWRSSFEDFKADMKWRPFGASIERKNRDGNYEPSNCKWATAKEQGRNKSNNAMITAFGQTKCLAEWVESSGFALTTLKRRMKKGMTGDDLFVEDQRKTRYKKRQA